MKVVNTSWLAVTLAVVSSSVASAQNDTPTPVINNWSYLGHSSTYEEGFLRGTAAAIQSVGQASYLKSVAAINIQEANRRRIENQNLYVRKLLENRELNAQYRARYASVAPTKEEWQRVTEAALPDRLTSE